MGSARPRPPRENQKFRSQLAAESLDALGKRGLQQIDIGAKADELEAKREILASERLVGGCGSQEFLVLLCRRRDALDRGEVSGMLSFAGHAKEVGQTEKTDAYR